MTVDTTYKNGSTNIIFIVGRHIDQYTFIDKNNTTIII